MFIQLFYPSLYGGGEIVFYQWAKELQRRGHEVYVITQRLEGQRVYENHQGIHIHRVGKVGSFNGNIVSISSHVSYFILSVLEGLRLLRKFKFDIIHSNTYTPVLCAQFCAKLMKIPHIATVHDVYLTSKKDFWKEWALQKDVPNITKWLGPILEKKISSSDVCAFHTVSKESFSDLKKMNVKKKIFLINNAIETSGYNHHISKPTKQAIYVGRLVFYKNIEILIEAFKKVLQKIPNARLVIVGDGPLRSKLEDKAKEAKISNQIIFKGYVSENEKIKLIQQSDVLLNPSFIEGFGLTVLEGFACEKPVIVSDVPPLPDLISDAEDGFIVKAFDSSEWAKKIIEVMSNPAQSVIMGKNGRTKLDAEFSLNKKVDNMIEMYNTVISNF